MKITISLDDMIVFERKIKSLGYQHVVYPTDFDWPVDEWLTGRKVKFVEDLGHGMTKITKCKVAKAALLWGDDTENNYFVFNDDKGVVYKTLRNREVMVK